MQHNCSIFFISNQLIHGATVSHPVDYRSHVNAVIGLLEDNRPLDKSTQVGVRVALLASNFFIFSKANF